MLDFEEGSGSAVFDLTSNGNNGNIIGATYSTDAPELSCPLTSVNGCDSVAVLNLTINDVSVDLGEDIISCSSTQLLDAGAGLIIIFGLQEILHKR